MSGDISADGLFAAISSSSAGVSTVFLSKTEVAF